MHYQGPEVYDDPEFSRRYLAKRQKTDNPNDALEKPVIQELVGPVEGKSVLDLGCGDGTFGLELLAAGAASYHGMDGSETMAELARRNLAETGAQVEIGNLNNWRFPARSFDLILSRLVLHYLEDLDPLFTTIFEHLTPGGDFVFSVEHPVITSSYESYNNVAGKRGNWIVDNYFDNGPRENVWIDKKVIKYHKTIETYFQCCQRAGFTVDRIRESCPRPEQFEQVESYERRKRIPLFLFFKLKKT